MGANGELIGAIANLEDKFEQNAFSIQIFFWLAATCGHNE